MFPFYTIPDERRTRSACTGARAVRSTCPCPSLPREPRHDPPAPNLDDRRFQELVDDAKRLVQQRCPEWTDHNVSDPGVTLIETFACMTDQLLYRLNRVPDRNYVKFLELIGVRLFPPTAARGRVTFWLSGAAARGRRGPVGHRGRDPPPAAPTTRSSFTTTDELRDRLGDALARRLVDRRQGEERDHTDTLAGSNPAGFYPFDQVPKPGDALLVGSHRRGAGLRRAPAARLPRSRASASIPTDPPLVWEAWTGERLGARATSTRTAPAVSTAPATSCFTCRTTHEASLVLNQRAGWLRCRVVRARTRASPPTARRRRIRALRLATPSAGRSTRCTPRRSRTSCSGCPRACRRSASRLEREPDRARATARACSRSAAATAGRSGTRSCTSPTRARTTTTSCSMPCPARCELGPAVRERDGSLTPATARCRRRARCCASARTAAAAGARGNVTRGALTVLKSSIPFVSRVENRRPARGGVDGEDLENAQVRGPMLLRTRGVAR